MQQSENFTNQYSVLLRTSGSGKASIKAQADILFAYFKDQRDARIAFFLFHLGSQWFAVEKVYFSSYQHDLCKALDYEGVLCHCTIQLIGKRFLVGVLHVLCLRLSCLGPTTGSPNLVHDIDSLRASASK